MKKQFPSIAKLVKDKRKELRISQYSVSFDLGFQARGQFISNLERGLCSIPKKDIAKLSSILKVDQDEIITAMIEDYALELYSYKEQNIERIY
jgi:transcriptional regulator with XRE-family HTH domain